MTISTTIFCSRRKRPPVDLRQTSTVLLEKPQASWRCSCVNNFEIRLSIGRSCNVPFRFYSEFTDKECKQYVWSAHSLLKLKKMTQTRLRRNYSPLPRTGLTVWNFNTMYLHRSYVRIFVRQARENTSGTRRTLYSALYPLLRMRLVLLL